MLDRDWEKIRHFTKTENWGDASKMSFALVHLLDQFRAHLGQEIYVSCGTQGTHVKDSAHYRGEAVDVIIDVGEKEPLDYILLALKFPFTGIGIYPKWRHPRFQRPLGFHLDVRDVSTLPRGVVQATWIGVPKATGGNTYCAFDAANLRRYELITRAPSPIYGLPLRAP
jgi:hypothetical protein